MDFLLEPPEVVERMEPHPLPLTIHLIAESIFSHLESIEDLLSCRQVAWLWRQTVIPLINSRSLEIRRITFSGSEAEIENTDNSDATPLPKLTEYMNYLKEESEMEPKLLFSHFRFYNLPLEEQLVQQFLDEFGHTIRKLDLNASEEPNHKEYDEIEFLRNFKKHSRHGGSVASLWKLLGTQCTQLEDLKFGQVNLEPGNEDQFLPFRSKIKRLAFLHYELDEDLQPLLSNIFRNCHLLERLILEYLEYDRYSQELFSSALCQSPHLSALKELTMDDAGIIRGWLAETADQDDIENLLMNLRLKKLKIECLIDEKVAGLNWLLQTQKTSLETLIVGSWLYFNREGNVVEIIQPARHIPSADVMDKLRELRILMSFDDLPFVFPPVDFLRQFPSLNTLILERGGRKIQMDSLFATGSEPQLMLQRLELPWGISHEHLRRAGEIFPNVKTVRISMVDELAVRQLFSQWPQLESLFLESFEGHDSILTGISPRLLEAMEKIRVAFGRDLNPYKAAPSIANFKYLKELRLDNSREAKPLTDSSLRCAISKLKNLEYLGVRGHKFSEKGIKGLLKSIPQLQLCRDEDKRWWKLGLQLQKDLTKEYNVRPIIDGEFGSYYYPE